MGTRVWIRRSLWRRWRTDRCEPLPSPSSGARASPFTLYSSYLTTRLPPRPASSLGRPQSSAIVIGRLLESNSTLTAVDLYRNKLGDAGGVQLARALRSNQTLTRLDLGHNSIGVEGGVALGAALAHNRALRALDLYHNELQDGGASAVWASMRQHPLIGQCLLELNLQYNRLSMRLKEEMRAQAGKRMTPAQRQQQRLLAQGLAHGAHSSTVAARASVLAAIRQRPPGRVIAAETPGEQPGRDQEDGGFKSEVMLHGAPIPLAKQQSGLAGGMASVNLILDGADTPSMILLVDRISEEVREAVDAGAKVDEYEGAEKI